MAAQTIGRYEIIGELGRGGMAVVYRAFDPRFRREVAVKILPPEFHHFPEYRARFEREALAVASLEHRAIVPVHDYGEAEGRLYLVMRHMPGGSLADRLQAGPLPLGEAALILTRIAPALDYAHSRHILHRDLKPANILFDDQGMPYLTDFGIVKLLEEDTSGLTGTGNLIGTPKYMSPEQALAGKSLDGRSDIYALGVILFEMLAGQAPFVADTPLRTALMHVNAPIPDIHTQQAGLPRAVQPVIERALAKEPEERYPTAAALAAALRDLPPDPPPVAVTAAAAVAVAPPAVSPADKTVKEPLPAPPATPSPAKPSPTPTAPTGAPPPARRAAPWWIYALLGVLGVILVIWALSNVVGGAGMPEATEVAEAAPATTVPAIVPEATETTEPATPTDSPTLPPTDTPLPSATMTRTPLPTRTVRPTATTTSTRQPTATFTNTPLPSPTSGALAAPTVAAVHVSDLNVEYDVNDCSARVLNPITFGAVSGSDDSIMLSWSQTCQLPEGYFFRITAQCRNLPRFRTIECSSGGDTTSHQMILTLPFQDPANAEVSLWILIRIITPTGSEARAYLGGTQGGTKLGTDWIYSSFERLVQKTQQ